MAKYFEFVHSKNSPSEIVINISSPKTKSNQIQKVVSLLSATPLKQNISKEGWLHKKSKHLKNYHKRFMQLKGDKLLSYKSDKFKQRNESPTEIFDLSLHVYRLEIHENVKEKFYLINCSMKSNSRTFKAETEFERNDWVQQIRNNIKNINNNYKNDNKLIKKQSPTFETIAIQMEHKTDTEMNDSDSENSDNDFGASLNINQSNMLQPTKHTCTISRRKSNIPNSELSFNNFRIRSLTIVPKNSQITNNITVTQHKIRSGSSSSSIKFSLSEAQTPCLHKQLNIFSIAEVEEKEELECNHDEEIITQLMMFGYERDEIIKVMQCVVNANNINEIRDKLDEKTDVDEQAIIDVQMTPAIELYDDDEIDMDASAKKAKKARLRKCILQEIVATEETYVDGLDTLLNELIQPIFDYGCVDKQYYKQIRSSIPKIYDFHRAFLKQLNAIKYNNESLPSVFNKCIKQNKEEFIDKYLEFVNDYEKILDLFGKTFHGNLELQQFLLNKRKEGKPLSGFLILPVQRVPRYILLLADLQKHTDVDSTDYNDIKDAVEMIKDITQEINERKKKIENLSQCLQIQEALIGLMEPIVNDNRIFIQQFIFIKATIKHQRLVFLFSDVVIIANEKWKVKHILDIRTLEVKIMSNKLKRKQQLSEFQLISVGFGSGVYIGENIDIVNKFKNLVGKWRVKLMTNDVRQRNETLGSLRNELGRQALLYDQ